MMPHKNPDVRKEYAKQLARKNRLNDPIRAKKYYTDNKEKVLARMRDRHLELTYGLTNEEYEKMLLNQDSRCAICYKHEDSKARNGSIKNLSVDHCHITGKVRKLLCSKCNSLLGMANESKETLYAAIKYLELFDE